MFQKYLYLSKIVALFILKEIIEELVSLSLSNVIR